MEQRRNRGFTMVSVMVGFLILLMGISVLFAALDVSRNMVITSTARLRKNESDLETLYRSPDYQDDSVGEISLGEDASDNGFRITGSVALDSSTEFYYFH